MVFEHLPATWLPKTPFFSNYDGVLGSSIVPRQQQSLHSRFDPSPVHLVCGYGLCSPSLLLVLRRQLHWTEFERQIVDRAVEGERHLVILVVHTCAGIDANVEGLVRHLQE